MQKVPLDIEDGVSYKCRHFEVKRIIKNYFIARYLLQFSDVLKALDFSAQRRFS